MDLTRASTDGVRMGDEVMNQLGAAPLEPGQSPVIESIVRQLGRAAGIPAPSLWLVPSGEPNAMAAGESPYVSAIGVTSGAIAMLQPSELHAVMAHEVGHIALGHLADRTADALKRRGVVLHNVGVGGRRVGNIIGAFHPLLGLGVQAAGLGTTAYGKSKINEGFAANRIQESEADQFAFNMGLSRPLATSLVKFGRCGTVADPLPDWAQALLAFGKVNADDHPPTADRVGAALAAHIGHDQICPYCWTLKVTGADCTCGHPVIGDDCPCGCRCGPDDRFCGSCGLMTPTTRCRFCGEAGSDPAAFCERCSFPLP